MQRGCTPIRGASDNDHHETVEVLLTHKADANVKTKVRRGEGCEDVPMGARRS